MNTEPTRINPGMHIPEPLIFERDRPGHPGAAQPRFYTGDAERERSTPMDIPSLSEPDTVRHFTRLGQRNFSVDLGMYPLGSCTMKYNPKVNEQIAALPGFTHTHPYWPESEIQGALAVIYDLEKQMNALTGLAATTLVPAAGAHGEYTALSVIRAYFENKKTPHKNVVLIPDSAHGTNPASCVAAGFEVKPVAAGARGRLGVDVVKAVLDDRVAALMVTNPNTLGVFETDIKAIAQSLHEAGAFLYCDGANMNAFVGAYQPAAFGVDLMHTNLHKTFSTPHGGGGPGAGPVSVCAELAPYLPAPRVVCENGVYRVAEPDPRSIGRVKPYFGQFLVLIRAWAYITLCGRNGLREVSRHAVLAARYVQHRLKDVFAADGESDPCMHEVVFSDAAFKGTPVKTLDVAKALMDFGFHPPTVYFPLVVSGALLIEPTECESKAELDKFIDTMRFLAHQAKENPAYFEACPRMAPSARVDEVKATRDLAVAEGQSG